MKYSLRSFAILATMLLAMGAADIWAEATPIPSLYQYSLPNGLTLFVAENHSVPLTYIEIALKCGAFTQEKANAGLFHLYEHLMFKGNALFPDAASVTRELSNMGVANWNGSTDIECVNYYFTVPAKLTQEGLAFWNAAIRTPKISKKELENEKKVVISEIKSNLTDPSRKIIATRSKMLFSDAPYKLDPSGTVATIKKATVEQLRAIQKQYYIPRNAALFVGGDVEPDAVFKMVSEIYGDWENGEAAAEATFHHDIAPLDDTMKIVIPYEKIADNVAQISISFRGPDGEFDRQDTFVADVLSSVLSNPSSAFVTQFAQDKVLGILSRDYIWSSYPTRRTAGVFSFGAVMSCGGEAIADKTDLFIDILNAYLGEVDKTVSEDEIAQVSKRLIDSDIYNQEDAATLLNTVRFWWVNCDVDYYYSYKDNLAKVTMSDIKSFVQKYLTGKKSLVMVMVSPSVHKNQAGKFKSNGFACVK